MDGQHTGLLTTRPSLSAGVVALLCWDVSGTMRVWCPVERILTEALHATCISWKDMKHPHPNLECLWTLLKTWTETKGEDDVVIKEKTWFRNQSSALFQMNEIVPSRKGLLWFDKHELAKTKVCSKVMQYYDVVFGKKWCSLGSKPYGCPPELQPCSWLFSYTSTSQSV